MGKVNKYDAVLPGLPKLPPEDLSRQERIDQSKQNIVYRNDAPLLAEAYIALRAKKDAINKLLAEVNFDIEVHEQLLVESQETAAHGWGMFGAKDNALRLASGDTVRVQPEPTGRVVDKEAFRQWCITNGYERQLQLWPSTVSAVIKERLLKGVPEPEGTEVFYYNKVVLTKKGEE